MKRTPGRIFATVLIALLLAAVPTFAQDGDVLDAGLDAWYTPSGGAQISVSIPAGTFCGGSSGRLSRTIKFKGVPLTTAPALDDVDTIIARDAAYFNNNEATADLRIVALSLESVTDVTVNCGGYTEVWETEVSLAATQADGSITFYRDEDGTGGTFEASFPVNASLTFTNAADATQTAGPVATVDTVTTASSSWVTLPPAGAQPTNQVVWVDLDDDGIAEHNTGLTTGPGFWPDEPVEHEGPHPSTCLTPGSDCPEWTPPTCTEPHVVTTLSNAVVKGVGFVFDEQVAVAQEQGLVTSKAVVTASQVDQATLQTAVRDICVSVVGAEYLR